MHWQRLTCDRARDELEIRVQERTEELAAANRELSDEIAETQGDRTAASHSNCRDGRRCQRHHYHRSQRHHALDKPGHDPDQWLRKGRIDRSQYTIVQLGKE